MKINCCPIVLKKEEVINIANKKGNVIGRLLLAGHEIKDIKLLYIENKIVTYDMTYQPIPLAKKIFKNMKERKQKISVIGNGSTGGIALYDSPPAIEKREIEDENIQYSIFEDDRFINKGKILARRIVRRQVGGFVTFDLNKIESIFRPYYVAFYGELIEGNKVRYLPIPADGCKVQKTF